MAVSAARYGKICYIELNSLAKQGRFDYCVIESTGIAEPLPIAETFTFRDDDGKSLADHARLDTMVTVVDAVNFMRDYMEALTLKEINADLGDDDERNIADLLVDQIEFCDVILDLQSRFDYSGGIGRPESHPDQPKPRCRDHPDGHGTTCRSRKSCIRNVSTLTKPAQAPGWLQELRGTHSPETEEYGISAASAIALEGRSILNAFTITCIMPIGPTAPCCAPKAFFGSLPALNGSAPGRRQAVPCSMAARGAGGRAFPNRMAGNLSQRHPGKLARTVWRLSARTRVYRAAYECRTNLSELDACLLTDAEMAEGETGMATLSG